MKFVNLLAVISLFFVVSSQAPQVAEKNAPSKITIPSKEERVLDPPVDSWPAGCFALRSGRQDAALSVFRPGNIE
jgi:hypothetical protein